MLRPMPAKLYAVPGSHPAATAQKALELKGIAYKRVDLVPVFHKAVQKLRFGGGTVPGVVFEDGTKVLGSVPILHALEQRVPEPALYPAERLAEIEEAERWGNDVLQPLVRRLIWWGLSNKHAAQLSFAEDAKLVPPVPRPMAKLSSGTVAWAERRFNGVTEAAVRADLQALPGHLDHIDGLPRGAEPTAADLQLGSSVRLLSTLEDLQPLLSGRPCLDLAMRLFPRYPGRIPSGALPAA
jgi:glutathione S-transferase